MKMMKTWTCLGLLTLATGCADKPVAGTGGTPQEPGVDAVSYLAEREPEGAIPVGQARQGVKDQQPITVVGLIGGSTAPFVDGLAAFTIFRPKVPHLPAGEGCPTPWDYCCRQDEVKQNIATVKLVDANGQPVNQDARALLGVQELSTVVVEGQAQRDEAGNLSVAAERVFVKAEG